LMLQQAEQAAIQHRHHQREEKTDHRQRADQTDHRAGGQVRPGIGLEHGQAIGNPAGAATGIEFADGHGSSSANQPRLRAWWTKRFSTCRACGAAPTALRSACGLAPSRSSAMRRTWMYSRMCTVLNSGWNCTPQTCLRQRNAWQSSLSEVASTVASSGNVSTLCRCVVWTSKLAGKSLNSASSPACAFSATDTVPI